MELHENSSDSEDKVQVKTEPREEDIKGYAEDTMNELLAIYGYEKVDEGVTRELHLHHFSNKDDEREAEGSHDSIVIKQEVEDETGCDIKPSVSDSQISGPSSPADNHINNLSGAAVSATTSAECSDGENNPGAEYEIICAWCQHFGYKRYTLNTATESKAFCSEKCFAACRRAYFRRNKVCDWCRHIRHTKEYIDFQDGERKLQFCSEKCLHQYKMDVFCHETQALGSSGMPAVDSSSVLEPPVQASEQAGTGAVNSSDETEHGEGNMLLSVAADSSTQPYMLGNGVHQAAPQQGTDWPVLAARTQPKSKQHSNRTVIGVQHVAIAPKVTAGSQLLPKVTQVGTAAASVTPPNTFPTRVTPTNPTGQVFGLQTILQPGMGSSQVMGRTPVVVRGTHWPPVVRQIPGYVIPGQQQQQPSPRVIQPPRLILPTPPAGNPDIPNQGTTKTPDTSGRPQRTCTPDAKPSESSSSSVASLSHLLPPVTVMVPQPIFIPVPYPIPIPVPVQEDTFHAMRAACAASGLSPREASPNTCAPSPERSTSSSVPHRHHVSKAHNLDLRPGRYPPTIYHESTVHKQAHSEEASGVPQRTARSRYHGLLQPRDPASCPKINEPISCVDARQQAWLPFFKYRTLQRSASMDLSLARPREEGNTQAVHRPSRSDHDSSTIISRSSSNVSTNQETYLTPDVAVHLSGESSAKVREALRCHLTKRLSQSALNLTEVGKAPSPQDDLRRCQSLSRLRYLEPNHMEKLPELTDGYSSPSHCSSASSTQRSNQNPQEKEEDGEEDDEEQENQPSPQWEDPHAQPQESDEDTKEPESKRKCVNHI